MMSEDVVEACFVAFIFHRIRKVAGRSALEGSIKERGNTRRKVRPRRTTRRSRREAIQLRVWKHVPIPNQKVEVGESKRSVIRNGGKETAFFGFDGRNVEVSDFYFPTMVAEGGSENASTVCDVELYATMVGLEEDSRVLGPGSRTTPFERP
jgi:hypothetical protein